MGSILLLGFLIGLKHAVEADHIAAVASLNGRSRGARAAAGVAMAWGLGHTLTLILVGLLVIILGVVLSEQIALYLELAVGIMLCWLGYDVLKRLIKERIHFHFHNHTDAQYGFIRHFHAHSHTHKETHFRADHDHNHLHASNRANSWHGRLFSSHFTYTRGNQFAWKSHPLYYFIRFRNDVWYDVTFINNFFSTKKDG